MRSLIALLLSLWLAPAWAQVPLTGAGKGTPASSAVFDITYGNEVEDGGGTTSYSLPAVQAGSGSGSNGYPILAICIRSANAITTPTVTWGGVTATKVVEMITGSGPATYAGLFQSTTAIAPTTTATVGISSFGSAAVRAAAAGFMVATNTSAVPSGAAIVAQSLSGNTITGAVTVPSNGKSIVSNCNSSASWTASTVTSPAANISLDVSKLVASSTTIFAAAHDTTTRSGSQTYTIDFAVSTSLGAGVVAAWAP